MSSKKREVEKIELAFTGSYPSLNLNVVKEVKHCRTNQKIKMTIRAGLVKNTEITVATDHKGVRIQNNISHTNKFGICEFENLRFIGKSGRGNEIDLYFKINGNPLLKYSKAIKVTVDGQRANRKNKKALTNSLSFLSNHSDDSSPSVQSNSSIYSSESSDSSSRASPTFSIASNSSSNCPFEGNIPPSTCLEWNLNNYNQANYAAIVYKQRLGDLYYNYYRTIAQRSLNVYFNMFDVRTVQNEAMIEYYSHKIAEENLLKLEL